MTEKLCKTDKDLRLHVIYIDKKTVNAIMVL